MPEKRNISLESTFKSKDTEEFIDIYFYRPIGLKTAFLAERLNLTPNAVTYVSIVLGSVAGHLFFYDNIWINIAGMLLLICANILDSADGQLARMTGQTTKTGRFLDGFAGNLWFLSIYVHIGLRVISGGGPLAVFLLLLVTGVNHSFQAALADYYRNFYLYIVARVKNSRPDDSKDIDEELSRIRFQENPVGKIFTKLYSNYTKQQELLTPKLNKLFRYIQDKFDYPYPTDFRQEYKKYNKPLLKYTNILTTNTRFIALFISLFLDSVLLYIYFELTVLNVIFAYMVIRQESTSNRLLRGLKKSETEEIPEYSK
ncbi:MAG: CDP-alcohol phosphatidyltransferase family protein [Candidatus Kapaibacterium sp.]